MSGYIREGIDISDMLGKLYKRGAIRRVEDMYSKDLAKDEVDNVYEYFVEEIRLEYGIIDAVKDIECYGYLDSEVDECFDRDYRRLKNRGFKVFGVLDMRGWEEGVFLFIGIRNIGEDKVKVVSGKKKDSKEDICIEYGIRKVLSDIKACSPSICVNGNTLDIGVMIGYNEPMGLDYMRYVDMYRKKVIDLINSKLGLLPDKQNMVNGNGYGKANIRYMLKGKKSSLIALLLTKGLVRSSDLL